MRFGRLIIKISFWIIGLAIIGYITLVSYLILSPKLEGYANRREFDSKKWQLNLTTQDTIKQKMVDDLFLKYKIIGMTRVEVNRILGVPPKTNYFKDYEYVYWLGHERGIGVDSEWLGLKFENDVVIKADILTD